MDGKLCTFHGLVALLGQCRDPYLNDKVEAGRGRVSIRLAFQGYIITFPNGTLRDNL